VLCTSPAHPKCYGAANPLLIDPTRDPSMKCRQSRRVDATTRALSTRGDADQFLAVADGPHGGEPS